MLRLAPTFFRFGSFEIFKEKDKTSGRAGPSVGLKEQMMPEMLDFVIRNYYPQIHADKGETSKYQLLFEEIASRSAMMVAQWQCVGYVHGVMNTDNMSILGLTIDYGPFRFMDYFDPKMVSNHSDKEGRYCYENQPSVCKFNLMRLAEALDPLLPLAWSSEYLHSKFDELYSTAYLNIMARKLGFITPANSDRDSIKECEFELIQSLVEVLSATSADFTNTFRILAMISRDPDLT